MIRPTMTAISPFFIVSNVDRTIAFYRELGFQTTFQEPDQNPFFAIIRREGAQLFVKSHENVRPLPNPKRHPSMRWDAYVYAPDPDALAAEFLDHGATFSAPLKDTHDGLRGFELTDPDGMFCFSDARDRLRPASLHADGANHCLSASSLSLPQERRR
jgi:catechol 2,3-dioxygenase-like lactoylglutathione lyase family enzyme